MADELRRVQALHVGRVPRGVPDRRPVPDRVRHRRRAAGRLQRLRLLRAGLPVRGHRPAPGRRPGLEVHPVLRPAAGRPDAGLRPGLPDQSIQFGPLEELRARAAGRVDDLQSRRASRTPSCTGRTTDDGVGGFGAFFLLLDRPEIYGLPPDPAVDHEGRQGHVEGGRGRGRGRSPAWPSAPSPDGGTLMPKGERLMVPEASPTSYYGRPVIKEPVWKWPIPAYLFTGGLAAGSALLAAGCRARGDDALARREAIAALGRGRPERRLPGPGPGPAGAVRQHAAGGQADVAHERGQLDPGRLRPGRRARPRSPRPSASCPRAGRWPPRPRRPLLAPGPGDLHRGPARRHRGPGLARGPARAAVRVRRRGRRPAPAAWGCCWPAATRRSPGGRAARRMALAGAALEVGAHQLMRQRLGDAGRALRPGPGRRPAAGRRGAGPPGPRSWPRSAGNAAGGAAVAAGVALIAGSALERFAVFEAGRQSARDPKYTVGPQRARLSPARPEAPSVLRQCPCDVPAPCAPCWPAAGLAGCSAVSPVRRTIGRHPAEPELPAPVAGHLHRRHRHRQPWCGA